MLVDFAVGGYLFMKAAACASRFDDVEGRECVGACYREILSITVRNRLEITVGQLEIPYHEALLG